MQSKGKKIAVLAGVVSAVVLVTAAWTYRASLQFWWLFEALGRNEQGYPEYRHRQTGIVFVSLPGGTFMMGSAEDEGDRLFDELVAECDEVIRERVEKSIADEQPQHEVKLSPFLVAKYEVTQAQWLQAMNSNPSHFKGNNLPVEQVSWNDLHAGDGFLQRTGFLLPTEAQWEYACRAGKEGPYAGTGKLDEMGWYGGNSSDTTHPAGEKQPNGFGLYDMHGNAWEWCEDTYDEKFYSKAEASQKDPLSTSGSKYRVVRGGSWCYVASSCRSANRFCCPPSHRRDFFGFRPVWSRSPQSTTPGTHNRTH